MKTILYAWSDKARPQNIKFGDHTIDGNPTESEIYNNVKNYIKKDQSKSKYLWYDDQIIYHKFWDATDYAIKENKHYKNAKLDTYIANNSKLRLHRLSADFYKIDVEELISIVNEKIHGSFSLNTYKPDSYQLEAIDSAINFYTGGGQNFLLDCVMRFGKCFTSYQIAKKLNAKRILVITGRPKVKIGWRGDLDHVDFGKWRFIDSQTKSNVKFNDGESLFCFDDFENGRPGAEVVFASFQGGKRDDSRIQNILDQDIDLLIIDEAHSYFSESAIEFCQNIKSKYKLWVSGTPFKAYESGMFDGVTDTYRFTLGDLLRVKKEVEERLAKGEVVESGLLRYTEFPNVQFLVANYPDFTNSKDFDKLQRDQGLNMKSLLSNNSGVTNYPQEVNGLLDSLISGNRNNSPLTPPIRGNHRVQYPVTAKHIWMTVPPGPDDSKKDSVGSATTLETEIKNHSIMSLIYDPLVIKGDKTQDDVNRHITLSKSNNRGTINISCRSLNTGTTFPDLDTLVFLTETTSASEFWQTVGRVLQPQSGKKSVTVICYSVEMVVSMINKMVECSTNTGSHEAMTKEYLDMMPIFTMNPEIGTTRLDITDVYSLLSNRGSVIKALSDREVIGKNFEQLVLSDPDFFKSIPDINSDRDPNKVELSKSGERGKSELITKNKSNSSDDFIKESKERVREFLKLIGSVMAASAVYDDFIVTDVNDLINVKEMTIDSELYTGTKAIIVHLIKTGALNVKLLDRKIAAVHTVEIKPKLGIK